MAAVAGIVLCLVLYFFVKTTIKDSLEPATESSVLLRILVNSLQVRMRSFFGFFCFFVLALCLIAVFVKSFRLVACGLWPVTCGLWLVSGAGGGGGHELRGRVVDGGRPSCRDGNQRVDHPGRHLQLRLPAGGPSGRVQIQFDPPRCPASHLLRRGRHMVSRSGL